MDCPSSPLVTRSIARSAAEIQCESGDNWLLVYYWFYRLTGPRRPQTAPWTSSQPPPCCRGFYQGATSGRVSGTCSEEHHVLRLTVRTSSTRQPGSWAQHLHGLFYRTSPTRLLDLVLHFKTNVETENITHSRKCCLTWFYKNLVKKLMKQRQLTLNKSLLETFIFLNFEFCLKKKNV